MIWSRYQLAIFDFIKQTTGSCFISAVAGSGKTTVIVNGLTYLPTEKRNGFCAFNKHITIALESRVPLGTEVFTLNALGWRAALAHMSMMKPILLKRNTEKTERVLHEFLFDEKEFLKYRACVCRMVSLMKALNASEDSDLDWIVDRYDVETPDENNERLFSLVRDVFKRSATMLKYFDFDDQIFMPLRHNFPLPKFANLMIDEAQDLSPAQIELVVRVAQDRVMAVGDQRQGIYGFRGANPQAIKELIGRLNMQSLPLSICYRCPSSVVAEAKKIVPEIEPWEEAKVGVVDSISTTKFKDITQEKDYVLCRTTAPLVKSCLSFIRDGRRATVKGRDLGNSVIWTIRKIAPDNCSVSQFIPQMSAFRDREIGRLNELGQDARANALEDRLDTISAILEDGRLQFVTDLERKVRSIFEDDGAGITHCSIHRAKGLEADRVSILRPDLLPYPKAKKDWQIEQEWNLKYVGITRAMQELFWVKP